MPQTHVQGVVYEGERESGRSGEWEREGVRKVLAILLAQLHVSFPPQTLMLTPPHNITQSQRGCLFSLVSLSLVRFPLADRQAKRDGKRGKAGLAWQYFSLLSFGRSLKVNWLFLLSLSHSPPSLLCVFLAISRLVFFFFCRLNYCKLLSWFHSHCHSCTHSFIHSLGIHFD